MIFLNWYVLQKKITAPKKTVYNEKYKSKSPSKNVKKIYITNMHERTGFNL